METREFDKWNERHFQICLAMIAGELANPSNSIRTIGLKSIIVKAQRMVELLKEREEHMKTIK